MISYELLACIVVVAALWWGICAHIKREADAQYNYDTGLLMQAYMERADRGATIPSELTQVMAVRLGLRGLVIPKPPIR